MRVCLLLLMMALSSRAAQVIGVGSPTNNPFNGATLMTDGLHTYWAVGTNANVITNGDISVPFTNEFWLSSTPPVGNKTGTQSQPLDASTQPKFDKLMDDLYSTNTTPVIQLGAGTFVTTGGLGDNVAWAPCSNSRLIGRGMGITRIKMANYPTNDCWVIDNETLDGTTNVYIGNLTIDCNGQNNGSTNSVSGIQIWGRRTTLERVECVNVFGQYAGGKEGFGIMAWDTPLQHSGNLIRECVVSSPVSNYCSAVAVWSGQILDCQVYFPIITYPAFSGFYSAYNCGNSRNIEIRGCYAFGGTYGYYTDFYAATNVILAENFFSEMLYPISFNNVPGVSDVTIANNVLRVTATGSGQYPKTAISVTDGPLYNSTVTGNRIFVSGATNHIAYLRAVTNSVWSLNTWDETEADFNTNNTVSHLHAFKNFNTQGTLATALPQE